MSNKGKINLHIRHKKLWDWLYNNPGKDKDDYFLHKFSEPFDPQFLISCYACDIADITNKCPISKNGECTDSTLGCLDGLYRQWIQAVLRHDTVLAKSYAGAIRDLPWKGPKMFKPIA